MHTYPHLELVNGKKILMVHDRPYIMLAGEVETPIHRLSAIWSRSGTRRSSLT